MNVGHARPPVFVEAGDEFAQQPPVAFRQTRIKPLDAILDEIRLELGHGSGLRARLPAALQRHPTNSCANQT
jgi:hypothetical protein